MYKRRTFSSTTDRYYVKISESNTQKRVLELQKRTEYLFSVTVQKLCVKKKGRNNELYHEYQPQNLKRNRSIHVDELIEFKRFTLTSMLYTELPGDPSGPVEAERKKVTTRNCYLSYKMVI